MQDKIDQLNEDYTEEKKQALKVEEQFDKFKKKMESQEAEWKEATMSMAKLEIENDELNNEIR